MHVCSYLSMHVHVHMSDRWAVDNVRIGEDDVCGAEGLLMYVYMYVYVYEDDVCGAEGLYICMLHTYACMQTFVGPRVCAYACV